MNRLVIGFVLVAAIVAICAGIVVSGAYVPRAFAPVEDRTPVASTTASLDPFAAFRFEVVTDPVAQERGLGGRSDIPHGYGMLFVFPEADRYGFWMKDMLTSIDIIWLADDGTVLGIDEDIAPDTYPEAFYPPSPVRYVLETRAGEAALLGIRVWDRVPLPDSN